MAQAKQQQVRPGESWAAATRRANELFEYWEAKGYKISVTLVPVDTSVALTSRRYTLRSNLKNGCPPGYLADMARKAKIAERQRRDERAW